MTVICRPILDYLQSPLVLLAEIVSPVIEEVVLT